MLRQSNCQPDQKAKLRQGAFSSDRLMLGPPEKHRVFEHY